MNKIFEDLFVLELANNHLGDFSRAKKMIDECACAIKNFGGGIKAAIKFQLRDAKTFVHKDYTERNDIRYVRKVLDTVLDDCEYKKLYDYARKCGFLCAATPFDKKGVQMCNDFSVDIVKIASADIKDISLLKQVASLKKPVIASVGGASIEECDNLVSYFELNKIPLALNHCVSLYPCPNECLNLEKIKFLAHRYDNCTIGFSTHQKDSLECSISAAYALGARMIERHVDIEYEGKMRLEYCSKPNELEKIFKAYFLAKQMHSVEPYKELLVKEKERAVLNKFTRGVYAARDIKAQKTLQEDDFYYAIPALEGQMTHNDLILGKKINTDIKKDAPIFYNSVKIKTEV